MNTKAKGVTTDGTSPWMTEWVIKERQLLIMGRRIRGRDKGEVLGRSKEGQGKVMERSINVVYGPE